MTGYTPRSSDREGRDRAYVAAAVALLVGVFNPWLTARRTDRRQRDQLARAYKPCTVYILTRRGRPYDTADRA